jgi:hypothetical protein
VSCYAFFKGLLLLSQPPSCLNNFTFFLTEQRLGTLADGLECSPFAPGTCSLELTPDQRFVHSEFGKSWYAKRPNSFQYLYLTNRIRSRLYLHIFRGEPAITRFDYRFGPNHRSSEHFFTYNGSGLHLLLNRLHPAHG